MSLTDFLSNAPRFITNRFNSISKYVSQSLIPQEIIDERLKSKKTSSEKKQEMQRLKSISEEASILTFIFLINKFFNEGSKAAKDAVDTFAEFEVNGFYIGNNYFTGRNEKVLQGEELSKELLDAIQDDDAKNLILKSHYMSEIINKYKTFI